MATGRSRKNHRSSGATIGFTDPILWSKLFQNALALGGVSIEYQ
jgi:hypothetical protein